ncbi:SEL1-like repeat protein [Alysiella crassa]|uniref:Uncharacterized protein n=1 Tax=Alysiella crassa TaxID=153491 RepID=A0A376BK20_9NEIS|nr:SEL1-like repeat protein [Alysiella crassa]UOP07654.1 SEL1-like repeat protein [Alysiella crassa]SSY70117.1 Uncharacterised protein [Alysiella crassa]
MKNSFKTKCFIILLTACFSQISLAEQTIPTTTARLVDKNKTFTTWYATHIFGAGIDFRLKPLTAPLAYQWSVIYEYGLGVPKNLVVAQALHLYSQKVKIYQMDKRVALFVPPLPDLDNLSEAELSAAQTLADKMWAISQDKNPDKYIPKQSKILALLKEYTQ